MLVDGNTLHKHKYINMEREKEQIGRKKTRKKGNKKDRGDHSEN